MKILLSAFISFTLITAQAQPPKTAAGKNNPSAKVVRPKLKSTLGNYSDSAVVSVDEANQLITMPIKISDDKKSPYTINTYQFLYKRKGVTEDEETGKVSPITSIVSNQFSSTPISAIWLKTIQQQLQPGEELYFFDVVVKDAQGKLFFAPDIKIKTK